MSETYQDWIQNEEKYFYQANGMIQKASVQNTVCLYVYVRYLSLHLPFSYVREQQTFSPRLRDSDTFSETVDENSKIYKNKFCTR